ncbi:N-acetyltransferase family protein [Methanosarcina sp. MSH10X1]|uniref:GNAT family N-acetyltransferase n=1 Tax=Methanosarcina sp. MSH10X1 TaxID=2507075 RepID=UPI000FFC97A5|nr:GNAT family N-acetyltransferase [Methanosarcina sp. MSH10X1]RXA20459.1 N-acetyltransferase family protein [Methanosarcina sp. MSH10X1]
MQERDKLKALMIREATSEDTQGMLEIFNYYIENSFATYLETPVGPEFFQTSYNEGGPDKSQHPPFYVIEENNRVIGIGALRPYFPFRNFQHTGVVSYFILPEYTGKGLGARLLNVLCQDAEKKNMKSLLANVSSKNQASLNFHLKHGFVECGRFKAAGKKFGTYFDIVWFQKFLEESPQNKT